MLRNRVRILPQRLNRRSLHYSRTVPQIDESCVVSFGEPAPRVPVELVTTLHRASLCRTTNTNLQTLSGWTRSRLIFVRIIFIFLSGPQASVSYGRDGNGEAVTCRKTIYGGSQSLKGLLNHSLFHMVSRDQETASSTSFSSIPSWARRARTSSARLLWSGRRIMHSPSVLTSKYSTSGKRVTTASGRVIWFLTVFFASKAHPDGETRQQGNVINLAGLLTFAASSAWW